MKALALGLGPSCPLLGAEGLPVSTVFEIVRGNEPMVSDAFGELHRVDIDVDGDGRLDLLIGTTATSPKFWSPLIFVRRDGQVCLLGRMNLPWDSFFFDMSSMRLRVLSAERSDSELVAAETEFDLTGNSVTEAAARWELLDEQNPAGRVSSGAFQAAWKRRTAEGDRRVLRVELEAPFFEAVRQRKLVPWRLLSSSEHDLKLRAMQPIELADAALSSCGPSQP